MEVVHTIEVVIGTDVGVAIVVQLDGIVELVAVGEVV